MHKRLIVVGAGGLGREVHVWAQAAFAADPGWEFGGFLDASPNALMGLNTSGKVIADPEDYEPREDDFFACGIAHPGTKLRLCNLLCSRGAKFVTVVHPSSIIGPNCRIGEGSVICPRVTITTNVTIGSFVVLNLNVSVGHDASIGDGCTLMNYVDITGFVSLSQEVLVGSNASILPRVKVGQSSIVGAGSIVTRNVPAGSTVFGNPAKVICDKRDSSLLR